MLISHFILNFVILGTIPFAPFLWILQQLLMFIQ